MTLAGSGCGAVAAKDTRYATDGWGEKLVGEKDFRGSIENRDYSKAAGIGHFNIDDQPDIQAEVVGKVLRYLRR